MSRSWSSTPTTGSPPRTPTSPGYVVEEGRGLVIAVNKWDLVEDKTDKTFDEFVATLRRELPFIDFAAGRLDQRQDRAARRSASWSWRWTSGASAASASAPASSTGSSAAAVERNPPADRARASGPRSGTPPRPASRRPRSCCSPPIPASIHFSYRRYLENRIREAYGFDGTPIRLVFREQVAVEKRAARDAPAKARRSSIGQGQREDAAGAPAPMTAMEPTRARSPSSGPVPGARRWRRSSPSGSR